MTIDASAVARGAARVGPVVHAWRALKVLAKKMWFAEGTVRQSLAGPYRGLFFEIGPQMHSRMVVFYGAYEPDVSDLLARLALPGMVVYVCGAHVGIHTLHVGRLVAPDGRIYAFEPWPANLALLKRNVAHNARSIAPVTVVPRAVGAASGDCTLSAGHTDGTHHVTGEGEDPAVRAEITSLDDFWRESGAHPSILLIDVEGEELNVLKGAESLLRSGAAHLVIEHHGPYRRAQITEILTLQGYDVQPLGARHVYGKPGAGHPRGVTEQRLM